MARLTPRGATALSSRSSAWLWLWGCDSKSAVVMNCSNMLPASEFHSTEIEVRYGHQNVVREAAAMSSRHVNRHRKVDRLFGGSPRRAASCAFTAPPSRDI